jgi:transcriptional regulator with XRE-family HTH domain
LATGFASELRRLRIEKDLRRDVVADRAGISRQTLKRIEKGDTLAQPHTIEAVAKVLGANPAPLLKLRDRAHHNRAKTLRRRLNDGREP